MERAHNMVDLAKSMWSSVAVRMTLIDVLLFVAVIGAASTSAGVLRETEGAIKSSLEEFTVESEAVHGLHEELDVVIRSMAPPRADRTLAPAGPGLSAAQRRISNRIDDLSETIFQESDERARIERIRRTWAAATPLSVSEATRSRLTELDTEIDALIVTVEAHVIDHMQSAARVNRQALETVPPMVMLLVVVYVILRFWLSAWIHRSADELHEGMRSMAEGHLSTRIAKPAVTEFHKTAETLNHMAERLGRNQRLLTEVSVHDELTGLFNRREFERRLAQEIQRGRRYAHAVSLLMIDIDDFKLFNDRYGHMLGDRALSEVAAQLAGVVRPADLVARWGGEEFVILLPETPPNAAAAVADRALEAVWGAHVTSGGQRVPVTVSVGCATYPIDVSSDHELVAAADEALYTAKKAGKNRLAQQGVSA